MLNYNIKYKIVDLGISSIWNFPAFDLSAILENVSDQIQPRENGGWRKIHNFLLRRFLVQKERPAVIKFIQPKFVVNIKLKLGRESLLARMTTTIFQIFENPDINVKVTLNKHTRRCWCHCLIAFHQMTSSCLC